MDSLYAISVPPPQFSTGQVLQTLEAEYGLQGRVESLLSERDQNFRLQTEDGRQFVFKIANSSEPQLATDFQVEALLHLEKQQCPVATPRIQRTLGGGSATWIGAGDGNAHRCRLVSFLPGDLLSSTTVDAGLAAHLGDSAARLDLALADFTHDGDAQVLLWDLQRIGELPQLLGYLDDQGLHELVQTSIDDFDRHVAPVLPMLRSQVIHADLNPDNVLTTPTGQIAGVIDFGDMLRAPLIMEVAVAGSYLRPNAANRNEAGSLLSWVGPFVAAYNAVLPLHDYELELLFDLLRGRVAMSITILRWRAAIRGPGDAYSQANVPAEGAAIGFLRELTRLGPGRFQGEIQKFIENM